MRTPAVTSRTSATRARQRGSMAVEVAVLAPALLIILALVIGAGRVGQAHTTIDSAAQSTARAASLARTPAQAHADATTVAGQTLATQGLTCASQSISVNTAGFSAPLGQPATITATVTCTVPLADLLVPGMPGSRTLTATATSPLDSFRERR